MKRSELLAFLRAQKWACEASVSVHGAPQAAAIGIAITEELEIVFDTFDDSRKAENLRRNPKIALVVGWDNGVTIQIEGTTDEPQGDERDRLRAAYFERFPDGEARAAAGNVAYFRVRPSWIRVSDFRTREAVVTMFDLSEVSAVQSP